MTTTSTLIPGIPGSTSSPGLTYTGPSNSGLSFASLAGSLVSVLAVLVLLSFVAVFVIIVVANRADPDPSGRRPRSVYFFAVSFVTIGTTILGSTVVVVALVQLIGHHSGSITNLSLIHI